MLQIAPGRIKKITQTLELFEAAEENYGGEKFDERVLVFRYINECPAIR